MNAWVLVLQPMAEVRPRCDDIIAIGSTSLPHGRVCAPCDMGTQDALEFAPPPLATQPSTLHRLACHCPESFSGICLAICLPASDALRQRTLSALLTTCGAMDGEGAQWMAFNSIASAVALQDSLAVAGPGYGSLWYPCLQEGPHRKRASAALAAQ